MKIRLPNGKSISLTILPLEKILPHESTIPSLVASVKKDIGRTGFQRDPIVIDRKTGVVLDGMHRRSALSSLGARYGLCVQFDYLDKALLLERWLRYFIAPDSEFLGDLISLIGLKRAKSFKSAIHAVDSSLASIALLSARESYISEPQYDLLTAYQKLSRFDSLARSRNVEVQFHSEDGREMLFTSESVFVLYPTKLDKNRILKLAKSRRLLPFKSTRHIVPVRPMGIYFPLNLLMQSDIGKCKKALKDDLTECRIDLLDRDAWYEGRRYSEPLAVFRRR